MMYRICLSDGNRNDVINYIKKQKQNNVFTVIDVGSATGWTSDFADAICDMNEPESMPLNKNIIFFKMNINNPYDWNQVDRFITEHGKFDFSICTHTLEDISNPTFVCKKLEEISKAGYIAVPSKYIELSRFENTYYNYRGYIHHRWIFSIKDNKFIGYPKISVLEYDTLYDSIASLESEKRDLSFYWKDQIPIEIINNDYLGPSIEHVIEYYKNLFCDDLEENESIRRFYKQKQISQGHLKYLQNLKEQGFEPNVVYDIGACIGEWSDAVKIVWPNARCILFEAYDKLDNILSFTDYEYYITLLSDKDNNTVKFYQNDKSITGNSYYREIGCSVEYFPENSYVEKNTIRLDTLVKKYNIPLPDLVKIDVQGAEKDVLEGGWQTINTAKQLIVEMQHTEYNEGAPHVDETLPWIENHGWNCIAHLFNNNGPDGDYGFIKI